MCHATSENRVPRMKWNLDHSAKNRPSPASWLSCRSWEHIRVYGRTAKAQHICGFLRCLPLATCRAFSTSLPWALTQWKFPYSPTILSNLHLLTPWQLIGLHNLQTFGKVSLGPFSCIRDQCKIPQIRCIFAPRKAAMKLSEVFLVALIRRPQAYQSEV